MDDKEANKILTDKYKSKLSFKDITKPYYDEVKAEYHMPDKTTRTFNVAKKSFTISDNETLGRFFIHSIKLTFRK